MQIRYHNIHENRSFVAAVLGDEVIIGRSSTADVVLKSPYICPQAAVLRRGRNQWTLTVLNENGCLTDDAEIPAGTTVPIEPNGSFRLFPFEFTLDPENSAELTEDDIWVDLENRTLDLVRRMHISLLEQMNLNSVQTDQLQEEYLLRIERNLEVIARDAGILLESNRDLVLHLAGHCVRGELIDETLRYVDPEKTSPLSNNSAWSRNLTANPTLEQELARLMKSISSQIRLPANNQLTARMKQIDSEFRSAWRQVSGTALDSTLLYLCLRQLKKQIKDIVFGYGPLEDLLRLPTITEIMVVGSDKVFVEREGVIENSGRRFVSDEVTLAVIERIVSRVGRRLDKSQPVADARLSDGSRVNAVASPVSLDGPLLTVRKFPTRRITLRELIEERGSLTTAAASFLEACVLGRKNILISGGTGTGKTTMLNCLADFIQDKERIVTIEDTAELRLNKRHVARMETKPANVEGNGQYDIADLVRNALRMRPDRVVVGECRGKEALWMLQAMNTGHDGSMTTIHANSAKDVILRLEVMVQTAADLPVSSIHRQISSAVDVIVQLERQRNGRRVVSEITEVLPSQERDPAVRIRRIFERRPDGELQPTGQLPTFMSELLGQKLLDLQTLYL
ncbi:MAG: Flp pilus assembly complex ATPase component TadA [Planctomyces sp.]|nr:Flp pilus assembly complex ATPase component TadA [Planctomyces sp.]